MGEGGPIVERRIDHLVSRESALRIGDGRVADLAAPTFDEGDRQAVGSEGPDGRRDLSRGDRREQVLDESDGLLYLEPPDEGPREDVARVVGRDGNLGEAEHPRGLIESNVADQARAAGRGTDDAQLHRDVAGKRQKLREFQIGQYIREDGPKSHQKKTGTPTMGGVLIVIAILLPTVLWSDLSIPFVWICIFSTLAFGAVGFADDYIKVVRRRNLGLTARAKLLGQGIAAVVVAAALAVLQQFRMFSVQLSVPFVKSLRPDLAIRN